MSRTKLTNNEKALLQAFWNNEYVDGEEHPYPWSFAVTTASGIAKKSAPGVFASLSQKGLITVHDREKGESYNAVAVTASGHAAAVQHGLIINTKHNGRDYWTAAAEVVVTPAPTKVKKDKAVKTTTVSKRDLRAAKRVIHRYLRAAICCTEERETAALAANKKLAHNDAKLDAALALLA